MACLSSWNLNLSPKISPRVSCVVKAGCDGQPEPWTVAFLAQGAHYFSFFSGHCPLWSQSHAAAFERLLPGADSHGSRGGHGGQMVHWLCRRSAGQSPCRCATSCRRGEVEQCWTKNYCKHTVYCISKTYMAQIPKLYQYIARISVSMCISVSIIEPNLRHFDYPIILSLSNDTEVSHSQMLHCFGLFWVIDWLIHVLYSQKMVRRSTLTVLVRGWCRRHSARERERDRGVCCRHRRTQTQTRNTHDSWSYKCNKETRYVDFACSIAMYNYPHLCTQDRACIDMNSFVLPNFIWFLFSAHFRLILIWRSPTPTVGVACWCWAETALWAERFAAWRCSEDSKSPLWVDVGRTPSLAIRSWTRFLGKSGDIWDKCRTSFFKTCAELGTSLYIFDKDYLMRFWGV